MPLLWKIIIFYWIGILLPFSQGYDSSVTISLGKIRGHYKTSFNQRKFSAFEGIPYAQPPIGENRFEESHPIEKWHGIWEAKFLIECAQVFSTEEKLIISGDEDCLYLNVYVPREHVNASDNLDVVVHIHGGGFIVGSGHSYASPEYLMDHDVIFVTFNYRLGIFGFLSTEDDVVPGNNGLKDQVLALKWIQSNIRDFGGNPNSVTITGASAGGSSVHLHYFSPMSRGLFKNGFSQSGCALNPMLLQKEALLKAKMLALSVGCPEEPSEELIRCLKTRNDHQLLSKIDLFYVYKYLPLMPFGLVIEKGNRSFLTQEPYSLLIQKQVQDLPWMASFVKDEGGILVNKFRNHMSELGNVWKDFAPFILHYNYTLPRSRWGSVAEKIQEFYLGTKREFKDEDYDTFVKIITDRIMTDGIVEAVKLQSKASNASVFLYDMSYTGDTKDTVEHGDDNQYFFYDSTGKKPTKNELKMKDVMVNLLLSYAKNGQPVVDEIVWTPVEANKLNNLHISGPNRQDIELQTNNKFANHDFWKSLGFAENQNNIKIA